MKEKERPKSIKQLLMMELNVIQNLTSRKRYQTYNLVGHDMQITALDANYGLICSGAKDNKVIIWDIKTKKSY